MLAALRFAILVLLLSSSAQSQDLDVSATPLDITSQLEIAQTATPTENAAAISFRPLAADTLSLNYTDNCVWLRIGLVNSANDPVDRILYFSSALTGHVQLADSTSNLMSGSAIPLSERQIPERRTAFLLHFLPHQHKILVLQRTSHHALSTRLFVVDPLRFSQSEAQETKVLWFYFGGILCLIFYNFLLACYRLDLGYFSYCLFAGSFAGTALNVFGLLDSEILPLATTTWSNFLMSFTSLTALLSLCFVSVFLNFRHHCRQGIPFLVFGGLINIITFLVGTFGTNEALRVQFGNLTDFGIVYDLVVLIVCAAVAFARGQKLAIFFLLSWISMAAGVFSWFAVMKNLIAATFWTQSGLLLGNMGEMVMLSLGLAYKINILDQERKLAEERAQSADRYHQLVRVLSHDVANGLSMISGYVLRLRRLISLDSPALKPVLRLESLLENLTGVLGFVRSEEVIISFRKTAKLEPVSVPEVVQELLQLFEQKLEEKNLKVTFQATENLKIRADRSVLLNQILANLMTNAIKFSFPSGAIEVSVDIIGADVVIQLRDHGCGMLEIQRSQIFRDRVTTSTSGTLQEKGSGLGTWLVGEYTKVFAGRIVVESQHESLSTECGTTIHLFFPRVG